MPLVSDAGDAGRVFALDVPGIGKGARYRFVLDGDEVTDPYARFLPEGVDAPARVESLSHAWSQPAVGAPSDLVIYELHIGTFTPEGTYRGAAERLHYIADLGVTAVEVMPIAAFAGRRGWGYDGVAHFAPFAPYGSPEDLATFVDAAHGLGLAVILDVVYNHFGPHGNSLRRLAPDAFTSRFSSVWGEAPDFANEVMRAYVLDNARYWLTDFRFDGLRLDATHAIHDDQRPHILEAIVRVAHEASPPRFLIAEDERNDAQFVRGVGMDAVWADDFHHQLHVALTRERDGYYGAYSGSPSDIARTVERGWSYCGEIYPPKGVPRGTTTEDLEARQFVHCLQNHDQIGNRALGDRLTAGSGVDGFAAATLLLLTLPSTPLLFMGQEWGATTPFLYFTDHDDDLGRRVTEGRRREFASFRGFADDEARERIPDPQAEASFAASRLDWTEANRAPHAEVLALYRRLLAIRARDPVLRDRSRARTRAWCEGDLLTVDRWSDAGARRVLANLTPHSQPIPAGIARDWTLLVSSSRERAPSETLPPWTAALFARRETRQP
jgi:maltooligosyltrehalose trehalohydrolase